jgi:D-alanyl-D-alanine carboxypeptidase
MIAAGEDRPRVAAKTVRLTAAAAVVKSLRPQSRPMATAQMPVIAARDDIERALLAAQGVIPASTEASPTDIATVTPETRPEQRPTDIVLASAPAPEPEVVTRVSTSGGRHWGINVGRYSSEYKARQMLLQTALNEMATLDGSLRKVVQRPAGFDANFMGMTRESADLACRRLQAKKITCFMIGPS